MFVRRSHRINPWTSAALTNAVVRRSPRIDAVSRMQVAREKAAATAAAIEEKINANEKVAAKYGRKRKASVSASPGTKRTKPAPLHGSVAPAPKTWPKMAIRHGLISSAPEKTGTDASNTPTESIEEIRKRILEEEIRTRNIRWNVNRKKIDLCIVLNTTGSMPSWIRNFQTQITALLSELEAYGFPAKVSFVSYKEGHLEVHPWLDVANRPKMEELKTFIKGLSTTGGGDAPEDVAGGLEEAHKLFSLCTEESMKVCLLVADAPGHGFHGGHDAHRSHKGVDQRERMIHIVEKLFVEIGAELLFCDCHFNGGRNDNTGMVEEINKVLRPHGTSVDRFGIPGASEKIFLQKIVGQVSYLVQQGSHPVDTDIGTCEPSSPASSFKVVQNDDGLWYDAVIKQSDTAAATDEKKYYRIQLLKKVEDGKYYVWNKWGRTGESPAGWKLFGPFDKEDEALVIYKKNTGRQQRGTVPPSPSDGA